MPNPFNSTNNLKTLMFIYPRITEILSPHFVTSRTFRSVLAFYNTPLSLFFDIPAPHVSDIWHPEIKTNVTRSLENKPMQFSRLAKKGLGMTSTARAHSSTHPRLAWLKSAAPGRMWHSPHGDVRKRTVLGNVRTYGSGRNKTPDPPGFVSKFGPNMREVYLNNTLNGFIYFSA